MQLFANNIETTLASLISPSATAATVTDATDMPEPTGGDYFLLTLCARANNTESAFEIVKVTARAGAVCTIVRAQEGTTGIEHAAGVIAGIRLSAGTLEKSVENSIHGATAKTTPVDADEVGLIDSAASNALKKVTWANLKSGVTDDYLMTAGRIGNPLVHLPLKNDDNFITGVGSLTFTRSTTATYIDRYGVAQSAAIDALRFEKEGLLIEDSGENAALYSRDLTNTAWVKTSCTAALDATGRDGNATSASTLTATGANGTCLQVITNSSEERTFSVDIKRKTGTGTVEITLDGGSTWTDITSSLSTDWARLEDTQTVTNSSFGFRLGTSGDEIIVDYTQNEALPFASSRIPTTTTALTRARDECSFVFAENFPALDAVALTFLLDFDLLGFPGHAQTLYRNGDTHLLFLDVYAADEITYGYGDYSRPFFTVTPNTTYRACHVLGTGVHQVYMDGVFVVESASSAMSTNPANIKLGCFISGSNQLYGHLANVRIYDVNLTAEEIKIA